MIRAPSVTVVIPTYNRERYLPTTLDSILSQDFAAFEILVVDDGSTDSTPALLRDYVQGHPGVIRVVTTENRGQASATNRGFDESRSDLICHINDDDVLLPGALARLVEAVQNGPDAVAAFGDYLEIDANGERLGRITALEFELPRILELAECTIGPGVLMRRAAVQAAGGWDRRFRYNADFEFVLRLALQGRFVRVPDVVSAHRQHETSITASERNPEMGREAIAVMDAFYARPGLPDDVLAVRPRAYRNSYFKAAILCEPAVNEPGERFLIEDLLAPSVTSRSKREDERGLVLRYEAELRRVHAALRERDDELRSLHAEIDALHRELEGRVRA